MKVYVVFYQQYESITFDGVFSTLELAKADRGYSGVLEFELDVPGEGTEVVGQEVPPTISVFRLSGRIRERERWQNTIAKKPTKL